MLSDTVKELGATLYEGSGGMAYISLMKSWPRPVIFMYVHGVHYLEVNVLFTFFQGRSPRLNKKMSELVDWVSDSLHDILGLSDTYTAEFLVGLAKKCSSSEAFLKKLKDMEQWP